MVASQGKVSEKSGNLDMDIEWQPWLRPLIDVRISFPFNILRTNGQNLTKFCIHINIDKI